jgi:hypothetical protein
MIPGRADDAGRGDGAAAGEAAARPTFRWEEAGSRSLNATACIVGNTREEIALLFGTADPEEPQSPEICVRLLSRILLRPSVAAGLATVLRETLKRHEAKYGPLGQSASPGTSGPLPVLLLPSSDANRAAARLLLHQVRGLRTPFGFERSFKLSQRVLLGNRFLATINKDAVGAAAHKNLTEICSLLGMPERLLPLFHEHLAEATFVHFGFEETETSSLYKVYLEFWSNWEDELSRRAAAAEPFLLHLGLKWDPSEPGRTAVTRYTCHPWLSIEEIRRRIGEVYSARDAAAPRQAVLAMAEAASRRTSPGRMLYLEVSEDDNPRHSFDLNLYKAGLRVQDLDAWAPEIWAHYELPADRFRQVYDCARPLALGHIAGGVDREGHDFLTIYYGMEEL